jgi:SAM-dependent methyltransferase
VTGIYDEPEMYELACAYRDVRGDVDALERWFVRHAQLAAQGPEGSADSAGGAAEQDPVSVLELAAGPAEHALELARRGVSAVALDLSPAMCARARDKAQAEGLALEVVHADMRDFDLGRQFGLLITMLNSVCHLMNLDDLVAHLRAAAAHTAPGGLYIMELAHPADFLTMVPRTSSEWDSDLGARQVHVRWGGADDAIDPVTQVTREHVLVTVRDAAGSRTLTDVVPNRFWTGTEVAAAVRLAGGFTVAGRYGDFADGVTLSAPEAWRMIIVLRREE